MVAELVRAATGAPIAGSAPTVDARHAARRQIEVRVPHAAWNPTGKVVRLAAGVGLWDKANDRYLLPQPTADATHPGGSGDAVAPPAFFNVAFRFNEPMPQVGDPAAHGAEPGVVARQGTRATRCARATSAPSTPTSTSASSRPTRTTSAACRSTGPIDRILASHFETAQGADFSDACFTERHAAPAPAQYQGRLQPYAIYVPRSPSRAAATA